MALTFSASPHWPVLAQDECEQVLPPPGQPPQSVSLYSSEQIASEPYQNISNTIVPPRRNADIDPEQLSRTGSRYSLLSPASTLSKLSSTYFETQQSRTETDHVVSNKLDIQDTTVSKVIVPKLSLPSYHSPQEAATKPSLRPCLNSITSSRSSSFRSVKSFRTLQSRRRSQDSLERLPSFLGRHHIQDKHNSLSRSFSFAGTRGLRSTTWNSTRYRVSSFGRPNIPARTASLGSIQEANTSRKLESRSVSISSAAEIQDLLSSNKEPLFIDLAKRADREFIFPATVPILDPEASLFRCRGHRIQSRDTLRRSSSSILNINAATPLVYKSRSSASLHSRKTREPVFVPKIILKTRHQIFNMNPLSVGDATVDDEAGDSSIAGHGHQAESTNGTTGGEHGGSGEQVATVAPGEDESASEVTQTPGNIHGAVAGQHGLEQAASTVATHSRRDVMLALGVTDQRSCARVQKRILRSAAFDDDDMEAGGAAVAASRAEQARRMEELVSEHEGPFTPSDVDTNSVYSTESDKGKGKAPEAGGRSRRDSTGTEESEIQNRPSYLEYAQMAPPASTKSFIGTMPQVTESNAETHTGPSDDPDFSAPVAQYIAENAATANAGVPGPFVDRKRERSHRINKLLRALRAPRAFRRRARHAGLTVENDTSIEEGTSHALARSHDAGEGQALESTIGSGVEGTDDNRPLNTSASSQERNADHNSSNIMGSSAEAMKNDHGTGTTISVGAERSATLYQRIRTKIHRVKTGLNFQKSPR